MGARKAVVIGAGIAGIAAAIRLSVQGFAVEVFEKNSLPGGKITGFIKDGFHFDAGPSLFVQPENIETLFSLAGESIGEYFSCRPVPVACKYFYENGKEITAYTNAVKFAAEMQEKTGEPRENVTAYLADAKKLYNCVGEIFLNHSLHKKRTWLSGNILKALPALRLSYLAKTIAGYNAKFKTSEAQQLFNRFATYNGSSPYKAPAMLSMIPHAEHNTGVFYPAGGMVSISNALYRLALKKGVIFHFGASVEKIICPENSAAGIVVDGKNVPADIVVNNADAHFTYSNLVGHAPRAKKVFRQERSSSAVVFYWGIKGSFSQLDLHNIFFSEDYPGEFYHIFSKKKLFSDPTVYINITSKMENGNAPPGCENWFVMINVPADTDYDAVEFRSTAKEYILRKLSRMLHTEIEPLILSEDFLHPQVIESRTGSYLGSIYGTSSNSKTAAFLRHANFTSYIKNLYFCGGSVHPGGGIPLCLKSAMIVSDLVERDQRTKIADHA